MDRRTLAAAGLALGGLAQVGYASLLGFAVPFGLLSLGEGVGLLLAAAGLARGGRLPGTWLVAGLALAGAAALPWFANIPQDPVGAAANVLNNTGSVLAAAGVVAWSLAALNPGLAAQALRAGIGLQFAGTAVRLPFATALNEWTLAFVVATLGFALATWALPAPEPAEPAPAAARQASPAAAKR